MLDKLQAASMRLRISPQSNAKLHVENSHLLDALQ